MKHVVVAQAPDTYHGWPANHGAWQRGPELLVGFLRGAWSYGGIHFIREPFEKVQARSLDYGETWTVEVPNVSFEGSNPTTAPYLDPATHIFRLCGAYDHGGEYVDQNGTVYASADFGHTWQGPFTMPGLELDQGPYMATHRTAFVADLFFLSWAEQGFDDHVTVARFNGERWSHVGIVCQDQYRAVMPAVAELNGVLYAALRRRTLGMACWIDVFASTDNGRTWAFFSEAAETGGNNGNPPALAVYDHRLWLAYANRTTWRVELKHSPDGQVWSEPIVLRQGMEQDIGYPRLFVRPAGLACVYYWSEAGEPQHIVATQYTP